MDMLESLNNAITYIEQHLDKEIDYGNVAKLPVFLNFTFKECSVL